MDGVVVSVTCPICGNTVVFTLQKDFSGGFSECCYNCSATVTCIVGWNGDKVQIYDVRSSGGARKI